MGSGVDYLGNAATGVIIFAMMPLAMTQNTLASIIRADGSPRKSCREKKVMEMYGDSPKAAKKNIARSDAARGAYYKSVSAQEWVLYVISLFAGKANGKMCSLR